MDKPYPFGAIKDFLVSAYDDDELAELFFDLCGDGIDVLGGNLSRPRLVMELVSFFKRRDDLPRLMAAMQRTRSERYAQTFPQFVSPAGALGSALRPAEAEMQQGQLDAVNLPRVQKEGGYLIDEPPADWDVEELTMRELLEAKLGANLSVENFVEADRFDSRDILRVRSRALLRVESEPGVSLINGRPALEFLPEELSVAQLTIMPLERQSTPPSFAQQSLEHVFLTQLAPLLLSANLKSSFASTTGTRRLRLTAELDQTVVNARVNGRPHQSFTTNQTVIGIQGYTRDYLLLLSYVSQATSNKAEIESQRAALQSLVDSFKLIKPADVAGEERRLAAAGETRYQKYMELNAAKIITFQFGVLHAQWQELDWDSADHSERVRGDARLILKAIAAFPVADETLAELKDLLEAIEQASAEEIKEFVLEPEPEEQTDPSAPEGSATRQERM